MALLLQDGVTTQLTQLTQIAENLNHLDDDGGDLRTLIPEIGSIIGKRNFIVHDSYEIDLDVVWRTATTLIPPLRLRLAVLLEHPRFGYD